MRSVSLSVQFVHEFRNLKTQTSRADFTTVVLWRSGDDISTFDVTQVAFLKVYYINWGGDVRTIGEGLNFPRRGFDASVPDRAHRASQREV